MNTWSDVHKICKTSYTGEWLGGWKKASKARWIYAMFYSYNYLNSIE